MMVSSWINACGIMAQQLRIRINWPRLRTNMSKQEGRAMSEDELRQWLTDAGFIREPDDAWVVNEPDLGHLDPTEVVSIEDV